MDKKAPTTLGILSRRKIEKNHGPPSMTHLCSYNLNHNPPHPVPDCQYSPRKQAQIYLTPGGSGLVVKLQNENLVVTLRPSVPFIPPVCVAAGSTDDYCYTPFFFSHLHHHAFDSSEVSGSSGIKRNIS